MACTCNMVDAYHGITEACCLRLQVEGAKQFCRLLPVFLFLILLVSLKGEKFDALYSVFTNEWRSFKS